MLKFLSKNQTLLILCVFGTLFRMLYGYHYTPWLQAPDQQAWELVLEQTSFRYHHLIHYPHEGGTILISLLSKLIELFTHFSSLTIVAIIIDFIVRYIQIYVVKNVINSTVANLFGIWTIFAAPSIIPWGTVNFGLHAISSVFPFLLVLILFKKKETFKYTFLSGAFLGLAFWFSYSNLILIPAFYIYLLISNSRIKEWGYATAGLVAVLILHFTVRLSFDAGFHLNEFGLFSIRGEDFSISDIQFGARLTEMKNLIAYSALALAHSNSYTWTISIIYNLFFMSSLIGFLMALKKRLFDKSMTIVLPILLLFLIAYFLSPFFYAKEMGHYIMFRHLTYILPLISVVIIGGLYTFKYKFVIGLFIGLGVFQSARMFTIETPKPNEMVTKASGWILGTKLGHDTAMLGRIISDNPKIKNLLLEGIGWGIAASILNNDHPHEKVNQLVNLIDRYPVTYRPKLISGVLFAFQEGITPVLNPDLRPELEEKLFKSDILLK